MDPFRLISKGGSKGILKEDKLSDNSRRGVTYSSRRTPPQGSKKVNQREEGRLLQQEEEANKKGGNEKTDESTVVGETVILLRGKASLSDGRYRCWCTAFLQLVYEVTGDWRILNREIQPSK